jgi:dimeric dUTPase (all-alpha-NTP-PPase superfamily)
MSANNKITSIGVSQDTLSIFRELSEKTKIPLFQIMEELAKEIAVILRDGLPDETTRVNYMAKAFLDKSCVVLQFSSLFLGVGEFEEKKVFKLC